MRFEHIGLSLLLIFSTMHALADSTLPTDLYVDELQNASLESRRLDPMPEQSPLAPGSARGFALPETGNYTAGLDGKPDSFIANTPRRGRLTPEARRALRQQINEARHDIYAPPH